MKKAFKFIGKTILWLLAIVVLILLALPLWISPVVCGVANSQAPKYIGTNFNLGKFSLNQYTGVLNVGDLSIANPTNFANENCVELGTLKVDVAMTTVLSNKIRFEEITLDGLKIATSLDAGNFRQIADNVANATAPTEGSAAATEEQTEATEKPVQVTEEPVEATEEEKKEMGIVIDRLVLKNIVVKIGSLPMPIPTITLEGIGAEKEEGATLQEVVAMIFEALQKSVGAIGDLLNGGIGLLQDGAGAVIEGAGELGGKVLDGAGELGGKVLDGAGELGGATVDVVSDGASVVVDGAGAVVEGAGELGGKVLDGAGELGGAALEGAGELGGKVLDGAGELGGAAVDAVGEGAGKAFDAVKGLFK